MVRDGSPLHAPVLGSLVGAALEASRAWLNAAYFARGGQRGRACVCVRVWGGWGGGMVPAVQRVLVLVAAGLRSN